MCDVMSNQRQLFKRLDGIWYWVLNGVEVSKTDARYWGLTPVKGGLQAEGSRSILEGLPQPDSQGAAA